MCGRQGIEDAGLLAVGHGCTRLERATLVRCRGLSLCGVNDFIAEVCFTFTFVLQATLIERKLHLTRLAGTLHAATSGHSSTYWKRYVLVVGGVAVVVGEDSRYLTDHCSSWT